MGSYTFSDVVPFVAHHVYDCSGSGVSSHLGVSPETLGMLMATEQEKGVQYQGWDGQGWDGIGRYRKLYADIWVKGACRVWVVNESPYRAGGAYEMALVAEDPESIEQFAQDWGFELPQGIEKFDTVQQTL